jgi:aminoglycoside phosphotransferase (APT) family kinase protein
VTILSVVHLPAGACLEALRDALKSVIGPESQSALARHYSNIADLVLSRWIAAEETLPSITRRHAEEARDQLDSARALLREIEPQGVPPAEATLQELLRRLGNAVSQATGPQANRFQALTRAAIATEAAIRTEWEAAIAAVAARPSRLPHPTAQAPDRSALEAYLRARFPNDRGLAIRSLARVPGGRSKDTLLLEVDGLSGLPASIVLRVDLGRYGTSVRAEYPLIAALHRSGIPVPEPLWLEEGTTPLGGAFLATRRMRGAPGGNMWGEGISVSAAVVKAFAESLAKLHRTPLRDLLPAVREAGARTATEAMIRDYEERWRASNPNASVPLELAFQWLRRELPRVEGAAALVHGDPGFQNMLVEGDELVCLLDWEFAHAGDPAEDLAYCRPTVSRVVPWERFLEHYQAAGGGAVTPARLEYFEIWRTVRNASLGTRMLRDFIDGAAGGLESCAVAVNTFPRIESQLAASLVRVLA